MLLVSQPVVPDFEKFTSYLRSSFDQKRFTNGGPLQSLLELRLRELTAARNLCLVTNGTVAISLALQALGIKGEVITTPFTFCASSHAITQSGAQEVFVDVNGTSLTIDPSQIEAAITPRTEAILGVHVYGQPCDVEAIQAIADRHGLAVIYDGAHAFNTSYKGKPIGHFGNATTYSFHATKLFHTGEGGAIETNDHTLADKIRLLRNFGIESEEVISECGINGKMSELSAALGLAVLDCIGEEHAARSALRLRYEELLGDVPGVTICTTSEDTRTGLYFIIRVDVSNDHGLRDRLQAGLKSHGILSRRYFYPLTSEAPFYRDRHNPVDTPVAFSASREVLALPFHGSITEKDALRISRAIRSIMLQETAS
jgi:dTDP-4-amino-4,6-dideoxygalactose transaminase